MSMLHVLAKSMFGYLERKVEQITFEWILARQKQCGKPKAPKT
jgi:hypothetical protein